MFESLHNAQGQWLDSAWHAPAAAPRAAVVIGHGVTANKDRAWAVALAEALAEAGYGALRFSFAGNGDSEGAFEDSCPSSEVADLGCVLDAVEREGLGPVAYVGHSMGAAVGVIAASRDRRIRALVSLAGMVDTAAFVERKFGDLAPGDLLWDKPDCPLSQRFLDDMRAVDSVEPLAADVTVPWLLVHGGADEVVPADESERVAARAGGDVELVLLGGVDHVFTGSAGPRAARRVVEWLERTTL